MSKENPFALPENKEVKSYLGFYEDMIGGYDLRKRHRSDMDEEMKVIFERPVDEEPIEQPAQEETVNEGNDII